MQVERGVAAPIVDALRQRGHAVSVSQGTGPFGRGQIIWQLANGAFVAGSDCRADGAAVGY